MSAVMPMTAASFAASTATTMSVAASSSFYRGTVLGDSPTGYWRLGESTGTTVANLVAGAGNGSYSGGLTLGANGHTADGDTAVTTDGQNGTMVSLGAAYNFDGTAPFSIELWMYTSDASATDYRRVVSAEAFDTNGRQGWDLLKAGSYFDGSAYQAYYCFERYRDGQYGGNCVGPVSIGAWHHFVGTYDGATIRLYLDGTLGFSSASSLSLVPRATGLTLGARADSGGNPYLGTLDDVAAYNYALTAAQVAQHYARGG